MAHLVGVEIGMQVVVEILGSLLLLFYIPTALSAELSIACKGQIFVDSILNVVTSFVLIFSFINNSCFVT